jgi:hypothetical protein
MQRYIGIALGALVTLGLLWFYDSTDFTNPTNAYLIAVVVGALVSAFWPIAIGFFLARRAKERREDQISKEVERQVAEQTKGQ